MNVTVNADASFCPDTKAGGYSVFVASKRGKVAKSDMFKHKTANSTVAEVKALVNGIYWGLKQGIIQPGDKVLLQCDCIAAMDKIVNRKQRTVNRWVKKYELRLSIKHVKAHVKIDDKTEGRFLSNHINDKRARKSMRYMRQKLKLQEAKKNAKI